MYWCVVCAFRKREGILLVKSVKRRAKLLLMMLKLRCLRRCWRCCRRRIAALFTPSIFDLCRTLKCCTKASAAKCTGRMRDMYEK